MSDQDQLVQLIYDGVDDPCGLQHALVAIAAYMGATQGQLMTIENGTTLVENRFHGGPESAFSDYLANWMDKDPRFTLSVQRQGVLLSDVADIDRALFERSAIYNELLRKSESNYTLFGNFRTDRNTLMALAIMRGQQGGPFAPAEIVRLEAIIPHLRRATRLRCLVGSMQAELDDLRRALDVHPSAIAILDATGNVVCANAAAEALFREPGGIGTERGMLAATAPAARRALAAAIARAVKEADASVAQLATAPSTVPISVPLGRAKGVMSLSVSLFALRPHSELREGAARTARVLALFHDPRRRIRLDAALVAQVYGLTATEAALATALAHGQTVADFARARGCTEQTARSHLKRVLDKTGTHRQPDLVRVLLTGTATHGLP